MPREIYFMAQFGFQGVDSAPSREGRSPCRGLLCRLVQGGDTGAMLHLQVLIDDVTWFETVRNIRWPDGVQCPTCGRSEVTTHGRDETSPARQRYLGQACTRRFDELTDTLLAGPHPPLRVWF